MLDFHESILDLLYMLYQISSIRVFHLFFDMITTGFDMLSVVQYSTEQRLDV